MKIVLRILLSVLLIDLGVGFYLKNLGYAKAGLVIGLGVLFFAFVLLPFFLYYRYRNKNIKDYTLDRDKINEIFDNLKNL